MFRFAATTTSYLGRANLQARRLIGALRFASIFVIFATPALQSAFAAAALQVSPVIVEIPAGGSVSTVTVGNTDSHPTTIQIRMFRWSQVDGEETLTPTEDVVASPPISTLQPNSSLEVRVIRVAKTEIATEESYRLILDQLPQPNGQGRANLAFLFREVLPVFFEPAARGAPEVAWSIARTESGYILHARNSGDRRLRISKVFLSAGRASVSIGGGLLGYALAHSENSWSFPVRQGSYQAGARVTLRGDTDAGTLRAVVPVYAEQ